MVTSKKEGSLPSFFLRKYFSMPFRSVIVLSLLLMLTSNISLFGQIGNNAPSQTKKNTSVYQDAPQQQQSSDPQMSKFQKLQDQTIYNKGFDKRRFFFGTDLGVQFGSTTAIEVSPTVGYTVHRMFKVGISLIFDYFRYGYYTPTGKVSFDEFIYGGSVFVRFFPIKYLFLHFEIQGLNQPSFDPLSNKSRLWMAYPLLGIGYNQPVSEKAALQLKLLWNLNSNTESIYANPLISLGFNISL